MVCAVFLRLYRLSDFTMFLSDQGRDAIIIHDIVTFKHFPTIGAPSSMGQVFLGPFYYYLIAPFLPLFGFNPLGLSVGVVILCMIGLIATVIVLKRELNKPTALLFLFFATFSFVIIEYSRFSWNPNLLPVFSFFTLYFFYRTITKKRVIDAIAWGIFFGLSFQLHHLALFMGGTMAVVWIFYFFKNKQKVLSLRNAAIAVGAFIFASAPLILFDIKNHFINLNNFLKTLSAPDTLAKSSVFQRIMDSNGTFFTNLLNIPFSAESALTILLLVVALVLFLLKKKKKIHLLITIHALHFVIYIFLFGLINIERHPHYYLTVYFSFFLVMSYLLIRFPIHNYIKFVVIGTICSVFIAINFPKYYFFKEVGNDQIGHSRRVAAFLSPKIGNQPFNIATWPVNFTEDNYTYFLILNGHRPLDRAKIEIANQMFVLCNQEPCEVLNSPSWNISMFGPAKIDKMWTFERIIIYKLVHADTK